MSDSVDQKMIIDDQVVNIVKGETHENIAEEEKELREEHAFPLARIKHLMALGANETVRLDSVKAMSKATELFIKEFTQKAYSFTKSKGKKTIMLQDLIEAVSTHENLEFIKDSGILSISRQSQETLSQMIVDQPEIT